MERQGIERIASRAKGSTMEVGAIALEEQPAADVPEDVAILYSWANLQGAKYRDFSASRREYRAEMRRRGAESLRDQELRATAEALRRPSQAHEAQVPGEISDPYSPRCLPEGEFFERPGTPMADLQIGRSQRQLEYIERATGAKITPDRVDGAGGYPPVAEPQTPSSSSTPIGSQPVPSMAYAEYRRYVGEGGRQPRPEPPSADRPADAHSQPLPSPWGFDPLAAQTPFQEGSGTQRFAAVSGEQRPDARWFALKGVFQRPTLDRSEEPQPYRYRSDELRTPLLAVLSLAGGVGKTSLVATLGRALSSLGEQVLLVDTTSRGLLPFYFGASELIPGVVRNFAPPPGSTDAPIHLVAYEVDRSGETQSREERNDRHHDHRYNRRNEDEEAEDRLAAALLEDSRGIQRVLLDLPASSGGVLRRVVRMNPTVLIPLTPDMNSVLTLRSVNQLLQGIQDGAGRPLAPFFLLNQFDPAQSLHGDVREVLRQQLGERLLPFVIHRAPAISEALAEGMTVLDYEPDSLAAQDYREVALWIRRVAAPLHPAHPLHGGLRQVRWSER